MKTYLFILATLLCIHTAFSQFDTSLFKGIKARSIGPAGMSGRISEVTAVESNPNIIYVGSATGGVWKSTSGGVAWKPIFDNQPVASIGAVAVFQPNPSIVWVGTGEGNPRNSSSVGNGVYKSIDGGETWVHLSLDKTEKIHRLILHPTNENIAYAAALGPTWGETTERGVFKTIDGGKTWTKVLYVNEKTGCADLVMDPSNPNKLFAAMWEHRRHPWFFKSGGPGSGLYVTHNAGEHWTKCVSEEGLPKGEYGRIGITIARNNSDIVYALIEAKKSALCRSDDGGRNWRMINTSDEVAPRPFYFADIRVDPKNENRLYSLHYNITVSEDGGKTFQSIGRLHSDHHALWIHPDNPNLILDGNDGGVGISYDRGRTWRFVDNLPLAQFYHINVDNELPYNVYGGMQDNGSWRGPSDIWQWGGIRNYHWKNVGGGDGFGVLSDPSDANVGYSMSQGGHLGRFNLQTGERKNIRPASPDEKTELRFNWNAAIAVDPFESKTIYYGSQFVHKSTDRGDSWTTISPDLTTNDTTKQKQDETGGLTIDNSTAENHTTIITIAPAPVQRGVMWVGTDDGNVQVTQDEGNTWTNVVSNISDLPKNTWCPHIEASKFDAGTAYTVFDDHRRSNWKTYIYKTENFGKSWTSLTKNDPTAGSKNEMWGYALVIEQDPVKKDLLYLGTEFGLWISFDDGMNWMKWKNGFPTASAMALIVHPREHDLVIGTHGRAAYIIDDVRPFRTLSKEIFEKPLHLFEIPGAYQHYTKSPEGYFSTGDAMFRGESKPYGAIITYTFNALKDSAEMKKKNGDDEKSEKESEQEKPSKEKKKVKIEVADASGKMIRHFEDEVEKGINRVVWNFRHDGFKQPRLDRPATDTIPPQGPEVMPGTYAVKMKYRKYEATQSVEVKAEPRVDISIDARQQKFDLMMYAGRKIEVISEMLDRITKVRKGIDAALEQLKDSTSEQAKAIKKSGKELKKKLTDFAEKCIPPSDEKGIRRSDDRLARKFQSVYGSLSSSYDAPTETDRINLKRAEARLDTLLVSFNKLMSDDVIAFKKKIDEMKVMFIPDYKAIDAEWKREK